MSNTFWLVFLLLNRLGVGSGKGCIRRNGKYVVLLCDGLDRSDIKSLTNPQIFVREESLLVLL